MGHLTFLFTDIEGSTALWERHPEAMRSALARHDAVLADVIAGCGGRVFKSLGDGVCAVFEQASPALSAALSLQHMLLQESWPTPEPLRVRIAIASGDAHVRNDDYFGPAINLAARLLSLCRGGQTLLSGTDALADAERSFGGAEVKHGCYRFKGIGEPVEVSELAPDFVDRAPPPDGEKAYRVVRIGDLWRPVREVTHNLAPERDQFIGREAALRGLAGRLEGGERLVTVLGAGGIGKTRLARRYAAAWLGEWPGGVYFCDLSEARSLEGIHFAVALALGVPLGGNDPGAQLGHAIAGRGVCLLILDNFEQVQQHAATTVGSWLDQAPQASFVVTSRERLQLAGENVYALEPMNVSHDAMTLFEVRARAQQPGFAVDATNRAHVARIVELLDGLPLAIELAAARVRMLSPAQIVERMKDRFALLAGAKGIAARQQTLRAAIDWSWDLLAPSEQSALAQCSVFDGGFTLPAAEAVLQLPEGAPLVIDAIQGLVDKSLLRASMPKSLRLDIAEPYFGMYLSIHEYASEKLQAFGEPCRAGAEQRHGRYFAGFGSEAAVSALTTHGGVIRRQQLAIELDNLVAACRRAIGRSDPDTAAPCFFAAWAVLEAQGPYSMAEALGRRIAAMDGLAPAHRAEVLIATAYAMNYIGQIEAADATNLEAVSVARASQDRRAEAKALRHLAIARHRAGRVNEAHELFAAALALTEPTERSQRAVLIAGLANLQLEQGRIAEALDSYQTALAQYRDTGNQAAEGVSLGNLGTLHHELGQFEEARAAYERALAIHREAGSLLQQAITLGNLGLLEKDQGRLDEAAAHYQTALSINREIGNRRGVGVILQQIGELERIRGDFTRAQAHFDEALAIHREVGNRRFEGSLLGQIGELMNDLRRFAVGLEHIHSGERLLRQIGDQLGLTRLLCAKGMALVGLGNATAARVALAEAETIADRLGVKPGSDLRGMIGCLRDAVN